MIFRRSTESRFKTDVQNLSPQAASLIKKCLAVNPDSRPTIEEVLEDPYFEGTPTEMPALSEEEQRLRTFIDDLIKRVNVHEFNGREAFETHFAEEITAQSSLEPELVEHFHSLALLFLFSEDPDREELEAEKD